MTGAKITKMVLIVFFLVLMLISIGCGRSDDPVKEKKESSSKKEERAVKRVNDFLIELETKGKIKAQDVLGMTLRVKNDTGQSKTVSYGSPRHHDFEVFDSGGNLVWCETCKDFFIQTIEDETLSVDQEIEYAASWELSDNEGNPVGAGVYRLRASWLALENGDSVEKEIEIVK